MVVPQLRGVFLDSMKHQVLTLGPPIEVAILIDGPLVHAGNESGLG
jgi:hypothetical protein